MNITEINETHSRLTARVTNRRMVYGVSSNPYDVSVADIITVFNGASPSRERSVKVVAHNARSMYLGKILVGILERLQNLLKSNPSMFDGDHSWAYIDSIARVSVKPEKRAFIVISDVGKAVLIPYMLLENSGAYVTKNTPYATRKAPRTEAFSELDIPKVEVSEAFAQLMLKKTNSDIERLSMVLLTLEAQHSTSVTHAGKQALKDTIQHIESTIKSLNLAAAKCRDNLKAPLLANRLAKVAGTNTPEEYLQALHLEVQRLTK